jgi:hypothetical protein
VQPADLADEILARTLDHLERFATYCPAFDLPRVFAGYPVGPDVRADLIFTLGLLGEAGVEEVAGVPVTAAIERLLRSVDGAGTNTFYSYRVAETVARYGPLDDTNPVVAALDAPAREQVARASDSTDWIELLDGALPANYAAVLARCELARAALGLEVDDNVVTDLLDRTTRLLSTNPKGYIDDSEDGTGARYDLYTADIYLFTEPFAPQLASAWEQGARGAVALVEAVSARNGAAIPWGRSTGALAVCLTAELGAMALARDLAEDRRLWLALVANASRRFEGWMTDGLINAHQHRSTYRYRGPARRLQMTLDCLGKMAWTALLLREAPTVGDPAEPPAHLFPSRDELVRFDDQAGVWTYRSQDLAFVVPFVGPTRTDYLPAPVNPTLFEVPVDSSLATGVPVVRAGDNVYAGAGAPASLDHTPDGLVVRWDGLPEVQSARHGGRMLAGSRTAHFRVDGRTLRVEEQLELDEVPEAISLQLTQAENRPLHVEWTTGPEARPSTIDVSGLEEYRSFWGELPLVHQLDIEPSTRVSFTWSVTPLFRVASQDLAHHYHRSIYGELTDRVTEIQLTLAHINNPDRAAERLSDVDFFHLHWPEWFVGLDLDAATRFVDLLRTHDVKLVWTQHNRVPHFKDPAAEPLYHFFAEHADAVIHHSRWGERVMRESYAYGEKTIHRVIPHPHFAPLMTDASSIDRADAEAELGLEPCATRIGILGAPRVEKDTQRFIEAFAASGRDDLQLVVLSLGPDESSPDDPRITAFPYEFVDRATYNRRLATIDVLALPFDPDGEMLTTGLVGDVVGLGLPALRSEWPYLDEVLGDAGIAFGWDPREMTATIDALDPLALEQATTASVALQDASAPSRVAELTFALLADLGTAKL